MLLQIPLIQLPTMVEKKVEQKLHHLNVCFKCQNANTKNPKTKENQKSFEPLTITLNSSIVRSFPTCMAIKSHFSSNGVEYFLFQRSQSTRMTNSEEKSDQSDM